MEKMKDCLSDINLSLAAKGLYSVLFQDCNREISQGYLLLTASADINETLDALSELEKEGYLALTWR